MEYMKIGDWGFQGDVIIERIEKLPEGVTLVKKPLAEGEVTGHAHRVNFDDVNVYADKDGNLFTVPKKDMYLIKHEEHNIVEVPLKKSDVGRVIPTKEYDHFLEESRKVVD